MKQVINTPDGDKIILVSANEFVVIKRLLGRKITLSTNTLSRIVQETQRTLGDKPEITGDIVVAVIQAYDRIVPNAVLMHSKDGEIETTEI